MAVVLFLTNLNHWSTEAKKQVGHTSPSLAPWKHRSDRETEAMSAGLASQRCHSTHSSRSRSSRWRGIVQMAELVLPSETYGSSNRGKQPVRRFEESSSGTREKQMRGWAGALELLLFLAWHYVGYTGFFSSRTKFKWNTWWVNISNYILKIEETAKSLGPAISGTAQVSAMK